MSVEAAIVVALSTYAPLVALTGGRVYNNRLPENTDSIFPCVTYEQVPGSASLQTASGAIVGSMPRFRFFVYAKKPDSGVPCEKPLKDALLTLWGTYEVQFLDQSDDVDPTTGLWFRRYDVRFIANGY